MTPFGLPVVPEVYMMVAKSSFLTAFIRSSTAVGSILPLLASISDQCVQLGN